MRQIIMMPSIFEAYKDNINTNKNTIMQSQYIISEECSWFHRQQNYAQALTMSTLSGIGVNRFGYFDQCSNDPTLRYFLMQYELQLEQKSSMVGYSGICYSSNCTSSDLVYISKSINQYIPHHYKNLEIIQPFRESDVWNPYTIFLILVLGVIVICNIVFTVRQIYNRIKSKNTPQRKPTQTTLLKPQPPNPTTLDNLSLISSYKFLFRRSSNQQRIKVIVGLRALSFLGITVHYILYLMLSMPTLPKPEQRYLYHLVNLWYFNDLWLMVGGFYFAVELRRNWTKCQSVKSVFFAFVRKAVKIVLLSLLAIVITSAVINSIKVGPMWTLTFIKFQKDCKYLNIFGECNFSLWLWQTQAYMCCIMCILFLLWNTRSKFCKILYIILNVLFILSSFLIVSQYQSQGYQKNLFNYLGNIIKCPVVGGISYIVGFNLGMAYCYFKVYRYKSKLLLMRILKYKLIRIILSVLGLTLLTSIYLYPFYFLQPQNPTPTPQTLFQLLRILTPTAYLILITTQLLGFQNLWGTLLRDRFMNIASTLSFSSYTLYPIICIVLVNNLQEDLYVSLSKIVCLWLSAIVIGLVGGVVLAGSVEVPVCRGVGFWLGRNVERAYIQFY